ncbi:hypothetical protein [Falsiroseomonas sp. CW058]|uniref:hypothetical protein n=1 Tax=Falsiroseomonas sp. CW058 TaxID=3388664 RepID=UPI003D31045A
MTISKPSPSPEAVAARHQAARERHQRSMRIAAAVARGRSAGAPPDDADTARLVAEFHARGGTVTQCEPGSGMPVPAEDKPKG